MLRSLVLLIAIVLAGCDTPSPQPAAPPSPAPALAELRTMADNGQPRTVIERKTGSTSNCPSLAVSVHEPEGTPPDQVAADLVRVMLNERVTDQCNGGNVWGYTDPADVGRTTYTNGRVSVDVDRGKRKVRFIMSGTEGWERVY